MVSRTLLAALFALALPSLAAADCYIKTETTTSGFAGLGGMKGETETWTSPTVQIERSKMDFSSPLVRRFASGSKSRTITDLDRGVIIQINDEDKTYTEYSFAAMKAHLAKARAQMEEAYDKPTGAERPVPRLRRGAEPEISIEVQADGPEKKFAGMKARRAILKMLSVGTDERTGDQVTFKIVYEAWLTPNFEAEADLQAFSAAYASNLGMDWEDGNPGFEAALGSAGIQGPRFDTEIRKLKGYPLAYTVRIGTVLSPEQKAEYAKMRAEQQSQKKDSGGGFGLGSLKKKVGKKLTEGIGDKIARSLFGPGISFDADGDPILFSMTSETKKVGRKSAGDKQSRIPDGYRKIELP